MAKYFVTTTVAGGDSRWEFATLGGAAKFASEFAQDALSSETPEDFAIAFDREDEIEREVQDEPRDTPKDQLDYEWNQPGAPFKSADY